MLDFYLRTSDADVICDGNRVFLKRLLCIDLGSRRVGLALSDPLKLFASPFLTLNFTGKKKLIAELLPIIEKQDIEKVIIGYPLNENGTESQGCRRSEELARQLTARGIKTELWDERYTSIGAESILKEAGLNWRKAIDKIDKIAASLILEDYIKTKEG